MTSISPVLRNEYVRTGRQLEVVAAAVRGNEPIAVVGVNCADKDKGNEDLIFEALERNTTVLNVRLLNFKAGRAIVSAITRFLARNNTVKTLEIAVAPDVTSTPEAASAILDIASSFHKNQSITTFRLENFNFQSDPEAISVFGSLISGTPHLLNLSFFNCKLTAKDIVTLARGIKQNRSFVLLHVFDRFWTPSNVQSSGILEDVAEIIGRRQYDVTFRFNSDDFLVRDGAYGTASDRQYEEWATNDYVELPTAQGTGVATVLAAHSGYKYDCQLLNGQLLFDVQGETLRRTRNFHHTETLYNLPELTDHAASAAAGPQIRDKSPSKRTATGNNDHHSASSTTSAIAPSATSGTVPMEAFRTGDHVEMRFYGDGTWYPAVVVNAHGSSPSRAILYDLKMDGDHSIETQIEYFMVRAVVPGSSNVTDNNYYDVGVYKRGDYVEMKQANGVWKRGRCAVDKKNGSYDIRMEDAVDHKGIFARWLRHHFRPNEPVEVRQLGKLAWRAAKVVKQDKYGGYTVEYEDAASDPGVPMEEHVSAKRLMPPGRESSRAAALVAYQQLQQQRLHHQPHHDDKRAPPSSSPSPPKVKKGASMSALPDSRSSSPQPSSSSMSPFKRLDSVKVRQPDQSWHAGRVERELSDGTFVIRYLDGSSEENVPGNDLKASKGAEDRDRGRDRDLHDRDGRQSHGRSQSPDRDHHHTHGRTPSSSRHHDRSGGGHGDDDDDHHHSNSKHQNRKHHASHHRDRDEEEDGEKGVRGSRDNSSRPRSASPGNGGSSSSKRPSHHDDEELDEHDRHVEQRRPVSAPSIRFSDEPDTNTHVGHSSSGINSRSYEQSLSERKPTAADSRAQHSNNHHNRHHHHDQINSHHSVVRFSDDSGSGSGNNSGSDNHFSSSFSHARHGTSSNGSPDHIHTSATAAPASTDKTYHVGNVVDVFTRKGKFDGRGVIASVSRDTLAVRFDDGTEDPSVLKSLARVNGPSSHPNQGHSTHHHTSQSPPPSQQVASTTAVFSVGASVEFRSETTRRYELGTVDRINRNGTLDVVLGNGEMAYRVDPATARLVVSVTATSSEAHHDTVLAAGHGTGHGAKAAAGTAALRSPRKDVANAAEIYGVHDHSTGTQNSLGYSHRYDPTFDTGVALTATHNSVSATNGLHAPANATVNTSNATVAADGFDKFEFTPLRRSMVADIQSNMVAALSIRDAVAALDVAKRLVHSGCESWQDVLRLANFIPFIYTGHHAATVTTAEDRGHQAILHFLQQIGVPLVIAAKLTYFIVVSKH